ncbi:MAG: hypothetical protein Q7S21_01475 [archaeon]|nr:hypothetical protein [archaeon]
MDLVFHYLIPLLVIYFVGIRHKHLHLLAFLAWVPDLEKLIPGMGRTIFHNIFFVLIATILIYVFLSVRKVSDKVKVTLLSFFFIFSHLILDLGGPVKLFYPLIDKYFQLEFVIQLVNRKIPMFFFNIKTYDYLTPSQSPYIITTEGMLIGIAAVALFLFYRSRNKDKIK